MEDKEIDIDEGKHREELVCQEDIAKIAKMSKEDLKDYAHSRLDKKLDLTRRISNLRMDVITLIKSKLDLPQTIQSENKDSGKEKPKKKKAKFVYEPKRQRVFEATEMLLKKSDLIPCWLIDKDGKEL